MAKDITWDSPFDESDNSDGNAPDHKNPVTSYAEVNGHHMREGNIVESANHSADARRDVYGEFDRLRNIKPYRRAH